MRPEYVCHTLRIRTYDRPTITAARRLAWHSVGGHVGELGAGTDARVRLRSGHHSAAGCAALGTPSSVGFL